MQALCAGDSADNVPGVPGIGVKTAALLINEYGDVETLLARAEEIKQPKRRQNLIEFAEQARISRQLVTLAQDVPVEEGMETFGLRDPDPVTLIGFFKDMEFNTLTRRVAERFEVDGDAIEATGAYDNGETPAPKKSEGSAPKDTRRRAARQALLKQASTRTWANSPTKRSPRWRRFSPG